MTIRESVRTYEGNGCRIACGQIPRSRGRSVTVTLTGESPFVREYGDGNEICPTAEGLCCAGAYLRDEGTGDRVLTVSSRRGEHALLLSLTEGRVSSVSVSLGSATFEPREIPINFATPLVGDPITVSGTTLRLTALRLGETAYAVVFLQKAKDLAWPALEHDLAQMHLFPRGMKILFAVASGEKALHLRASSDLGGDDACAALSAAVAEGILLPDRAVTVITSAWEGRAICTREGTLYFTCSIRSDFA